MWRGARAGAATVGAVLCVAGCSSPAPRPYAADLPAALPTTVASPPCVVADALASDGGGSSGLVSVDADPLGATLLWLPGLNSATCASQETSVGPGAAAALASDIRAAEKPVSGTVNCPADDGTAVVAYFRYADTSTEAVQFDLTGCAAVRAPGRDARLLTVTLRRDLSTGAPPAWASYVSA